MLKNGTGCDARASVVGCPPGVSPGSAWGAPGTPPRPGPHPANQRPFRLQATVRIKFNLQRLLVQLSHHITGGTAQRKRVVRQDRAQEARTGVIRFLKGLRVFYVAPKGTPGTKGQKPHGNRKHIFVQYQEHSKSARAMERMNGLLLCKVVDSPTLGKHHGKENPEGIQAQRGC